MACQKKTMVDLFSHAVQTLVPDIALMFHRTGIFIYNWMCLHCEVLHLSITPHVSVHCSFEVVVSSEGVAGKKTDAI